MPVTPRAPIKHADGSVTAFQAVELDGGQVINVGYHAPTGGIRFSAHGLAPMVLSYVALPGGKGGRLDLYLKPDPGRGQQIVG